MTCFVALTEVIYFILVKPSQRLSVTIAKYEGESPGLVVMGGESCSEGRGFESQHRILVGHFFTYICCKNCRRD